MSNAAKSVELICPPNGVERQLTILGQDVLVDDERVYNFARPSTAAVFGELISRTDHFLDATAIFEVGGFAINTASKQVSGLNHAVGPSVGFSPFEMVREEDGKKLIKGIGLITASEKLEFFGKEAVDLSRLDYIQQTIRALLAANPNQAFGVDDIAQFVAYKHPNIEVSTEQLVQCLSGMVRLHSARYKALENLRFGNERRDDGKKGKPVFSWVGKPERVQLKASEETVTAGGATNTTQSTKTPSAKPSSKHIY